MNELWQNWGLEEKLIVHGTEGEKVIVVVQDGHLPQHHSVWFMFIDYCKKQQLCVIR